MRVLLSTIGSRGDVQPLVALALQLKALGEDVRLCVPPDFRDWIESLGMQVTPIGPEVRKAMAKIPAVGDGKPPVIPPEDRRRMVEQTVADQFETIAAAGRGCDVLVGATVLQIAAPSVAEKMGIPYVFAAYCPRVVPSADHAPLPLSMQGQLPAPPTADNRALWCESAERFYNTWAALLNARRAALGLPPIDEVLYHIITEQPWLASDPVLGPWPDPADDAVLQTGAWIVPDERPLPPELTAFLDSDDPPVYFGFGSMRAPQDLSRVMIESSRALGRRAVVARGWTNLSLVDSERDCLAIDEVNQQALFKRVAAVVHHGGAGTTTAAAMAGAPQVVIPQIYDQHYWAQRVHELGIGTAHAPGTPSTESLGAALQHALRPDVAARAKSIAASMRIDGALTAARHLVNLKSLARS
jgi:vancomycin aglycone glucosyltransferase